MIATYASYVWACYGVTIATLIVIAVSARRSHMQAKQDAYRRIQMSEQMLGEKQS